MSIAPLIEIIKQRFSDSDGKIILTCLRQDPLVWQFVQDNAISHPYFIAVKDEVNVFSPAKIAIWLIEDSMDIALKDLENYETVLPSELKEKSRKALDTVLNTTLPPADLMTAGLLALALREIRKEKGSWKGLSKEIFIKGDHQTILKNIQIWQTPFACLRMLCQDFDDLFGEFIFGNSPFIAKTSIPIFIHAYLANPGDSENISDKLFTLTQNLPIDFQLELLKWMSENNQVETQVKLAKNLLQTKNNIDAFAKVFSEIEKIESPLEESDPLEITLPYSLAEDINKIAAFYYFSGNPEKAHEYYHKSQNLLENLSSQTFYQALAVDQNYSTSSQWFKLIQRLPNSTQARYLYIESLIQSENFQEAKKHLEELPPSDVKDFLIAQIENEKGEPKNTDTKISPAVLMPSHEDLYTRPNFYAIQPKFRPDSNLLRSFVNRNPLMINQDQMEKALESNSGEPDMLELSRDYLEKVHQIDRAIELSLYLERLKPQDIQQKRSLVRLYCVAGKWQEAFSISQELIKSAHSPQKEDLENFAVAALKIDRVDMSISICQNILKKDPKNSKALITLGEGYMLKGDVVKAIQHMEQVVEMIPEDPETWLTLARLWENCGQVDRSLEILNQGIVAVPNAPTLLRAIGKAYLNQNAPADAMTNLHKAYDIEPDHFDGRLDLAQVYYQLGQYEEAYQILKNDIDIYTNQPQVAKLLGYILLGLKEESKAEPIMLSAASQSPDDVEVVLDTAELIIQRMEPDQSSPDQISLEKLNEIITTTKSLGSDNFELDIFLADIDRLRGEYKKAFDAYSNLTETASREVLLSNWRLPFGLGQAAMSLGNHEIGIAALQDANQKSKQNLIVTQALAAAYQKVDLVEKAEHFAKAALKLDPQNATNVLWYANFEAQKNQPDESINALKEALLINPKHGDLKLSLIKNLISTGSMDEATSLLQEIIASNEMDAEHLHQAAYICVHLNDLDLATKALQNAHQQKEEPNPILLMDLAVIYSLLNQPDEALNTLVLPEKYLSAFPQMTLLRSDILCKLGKYQTALEELLAIKTNLEKTLTSKDQEEGLGSPSPLLYNFDFTFGGYLYRLGQLNRVLGEIETAKNIFLNALADQPDDSRFPNAAVEICLASLDFEKANEIANKVTEKSAKKEQLELFCNQAICFFLQKDHEKLSTLNIEYFDDRLTNPRILAVQSLIASVQGNDSLARDYLAQAKENIDNNPSKKTLHVLDSVFAQLMTYSTVAEATLNLGEYGNALEYFELAWSNLDNQPLTNWRYALGLITAAENQYIADNVSVTNHAPGKSILHPEKQQTIETLLESSASFLSHEEIACLRARAESAFTHHWPLSLNAYSCLNSPEEAAAIILGSEDPDLTQEILDAYPEEPKVLQAFAIYSLKHDLTKGRNAIEKALRLDTANPINHALLAMLNIDDPESALKSLKTALEFWQNEPEWHALSADLYARTGDVDSAEHHINQAIKYSPDNAHLWQKNADIQLQQNDLHEAKKAIEKSATYQSSNPKIWIQMADINRRLGNLTDAFQNIQKASDLSPDDIEISEHEAKFLLEQQQYTEAQKKAEKILATHSQNNTAIIILAKSLANQGKIEDALNSLDKAMGENRDEAILKLEYLKIKKTRDGIESVLPQLINLAQEYHHHPDILITLTDWLIQTNRLDKAEETAQIILKVLPDQAVVHLMLGRLQKKKGQLDQAIANFADAIAIEPTMVEAYIEMGKTYQERRNLEQAIKIFQEGTKNNGTDSRLFFHAGMALKECKDYSNAEMMLRQAKKYAPNDTNIIRQLGVITALNLINNLREVR